MSLDSKIAVEPLPHPPMTLTQAMARMEGFYVEGTRPQRNCNPGDIEFGRFTQSHGATQGDPRFAVFSTAAEGFNAMRALLSAGHYAGATVTQAVERWAPSNENDTERYIDLVCEWTGLTSETVIDAHL